MAFDTTNLIPHYINLDFKDMDNFYSITVEQYDADSSFICASLYDEGTPYVIPEGTTAAFGGTKPSSHIVLENAVIENNQIYYKISEQCTVKEGEYPVKFTLYLPNHAVKYTQEFKIKVNKATVLSDAVADVDEVNVLDQLIVDANAAIINTNTATQNAIEATNAANTATSNANIATTNANNAANLANEKASLADTATTNAINATENAIEATNNANMATANAISATEDAINATADTITATTNAITATNNANVATANTNQAIINANTAAERAIAAVGDLTIVEYDMDGGGAVEQSEYIDANGGSASIITD